MRHPGPDALSCCSGHSCPSTSSAPRLRTGSAASPRSSWYTVASFLGRVSNRVQDSLPLATGASTALLSRCCLPLQLTAAAATPSKLSCLLSLTGSGPADRLAAPLCRLHSAHREEDRGHQVGSESLPVRVSTWTTLCLLQHRTPPGFFRDAVGSACGRQQWQHLEYT